MAKNINIAQVPEVATISQLLGVDANNKWAKIQGAKFATAEQLTAVDNKATAAQSSAASATQTANEAKNTAESIEGTAAAAQSTASAAKNSAEKNDNLLMGAANWTASGDITVYAGNWINGTLDPKPAIGQLNVKFRCLSIEYYTAAHRVLTMKGMATYIGSNLHAKLTVVVRGGTTLGITDQSQGNQGTVTPIDPTNAGSNLALYVFSIEFCETYCVLECLYNCTFAPTNSVQLLLKGEGGGADVTVDSSLSSTSENPVQNKVVKAALDGKAPIESPVFTGTPTAPTPLALDSSNKLATTTMVQARLNYRHRNMSLNGVNWEFEGEIFDLKNSNDFWIFAGDHLAVANTPVCANTCIAQINPLSSSVQLNINLPNPNGYIKSVVFTGLEPGKGYIANIITVTNEQIQRGTWVTLTQNIG